MQLNGQTSGSTRAGDVVGSETECEGLAPRGHRRGVRVLAFTVAAFLAFGGLEASAQQTEVSDSAVIHFPQSHSGVSLSMSGNRDELNRISNFINRYSMPESGYMLRSVRVIGGASPEGSVSINERLSRGRAEGIFDYLFNGETVPDSVASFVFIGRDWRGLHKLVTGDKNVPYRTDVLALIEDILSDGTASPEASDRGLARLRLMHHGVPYRYLYARHFPELRASKLLVEYVPVPVVNEPVDTVPIVERIEFVDSLEVDTTLMQVQSAPCPCKPFYMDLKTNMLYDALALPSVGAEFYVGKNWSVGINWTYGWWSKDNRHRYWRAYGGDLNVRRWFGQSAEEKPLTGHHVGLYAGVVTYDFEFGSKGYMGGLPRRTLWDRCNYVAGVEYGYSLPIARRLNIDFTIGIGYLGGKYLEYKPQGKGYMWLRTMRLN